MDGRTGGEEVGRKQPKPLLTLSLFPSIPPSNMEPWWEMGGGRLNCGRAAKNCES